MLLLVMGLLLLTAQQRQLDSAVLLAASQQRYLLAYNQASSALSWGLSDTWPRQTLQATTWQCRQLGSEALQACIRPSSRANLLIVRGTGEAPGAEPLWLYQLASATQQGESITLHAQKGGWLDFCPEKRATDCEG